MTSRRRGSRTAAEIVAECEADPEYQAMIREREQKRAKRTARRRAEQAQLLRELAEVGIEVETVWDLVNRPNDYQSAYPILVEHLQRPYDELNREGIARSLAVADATDIAWKPVYRAFVDHPHAGPGDPPPLKFALGLALGKLMEAPQVPEALELVTNRAHGESRAPIVDFLGDFKQRKAVRTVLELLADDPDVAAEAKKALARKRKRRRR